MVVHQMLVQGDAPDVRAADIEALLIPAADETRWGGGWSMIPTTFTETETLPVRFVGDRLQVAQPDEPEDGQLMRGPNAVGGFVRLVPRPRPHAEGPVDRAAGRSPRWRWPTSCGTRASAPWSPARGRASSRPA